MVFSDKQEAVFKEVKEGKFHINIQATAGSGKTTTILNALSFVPFTKRTIFLSFSNGIVNELKTRVPNHIRASTLHSEGMRIMSNNFTFKVEGSKYFDLAMQEFAETVRKKKETRKECAIIQEICSFARMTLTPFKKKDLEELCAYYNIDFDGDFKLIDKAIKLLKKHTKADKLSVIDFADMIFFPAVYPELIKYQYDCIFLDEAQDTNKAQLRFVENILHKNGRLIAVGDERQCQPTGTMVLMGDGNEKKIEEINIGDELTGYDTNDWRGFRGKFMQRRRDGLLPMFPIVNEIANREFVGDLICIKSNERISKYTPDHLCYAKFKQDSIKAHVLYMMEKDGYFRLGISPLWCKNQGMFLSRKGHEGEDKFWILEIYNNRRESYLNEQFYSYSFGIPQIRFRDNGQKGLYTQEEMSELWKRFDKSILYNNAMLLLKNFHKEYSFPFWERNKARLKSDGPQSFFKFCLRKIRACNLFANYMEINFFKKENIQKKSENTDVCRVFYQPFSLFYEYYEGKVYSMSVSQYNNYIADGILTHNCIYGFSGSSIESFDRIKKRVNTTSLPLTVTYRCSKEVVKLAQSIYPKDIQHHPDAIDGFVGNGEIKDIDQGDMVICRNTRPLVSVFFKLLEVNKKSYIVGKDLEKGIISITEAAVKHSSNKDEVNKALEKKLETLLAELVKKEVFEPFTHPTYLNMSEKCNIIRFILNKVDRLDDLIPKIHDLFREVKDGIQLLTIHRSKGLESKRVFFLRSMNGRTLCPSPYAKKNWELIQENNLLYVAYTRAKESFFFIDYEETSI